MRTRVVALAAVLIAGAQGQDAAPDALEQKAMVSRMREFAIAYPDRLQDFICIQRTTRSAGPSATGDRWKLLETQELELSYVQHKEHYRLLKVNGQVTDLNKRIKQGPYFTPSGEFGSALLRIFDPKAAADFEWDHADGDGAERSCVFRYGVPEARSPMRMSVNGQLVQMGYRGVVWADCRTGAIARIQTETDPAAATLKGRRVAVGLRVDVRYATTMVGEKQFLLPREAVETALFYKTWTKAEIQFDRYRKYDASSTVKFEGDRDQ